MRSPQWYFDEDVIGVAKVLATAKLPVTWPGDDGKRSSQRLSQTPSLVSSTGRPDEEWIPLVAGAGMPIVTRDRRILDRRDEVNAVIAARARLFAITSSGPQSLWDQVRILAAQWPHMQARRVDDGPLLYGLTLSGIRRLYPD